MKPVLKIDSRGWWWKFYWATGSFPAASRHVVLYVGPFETADEAFRSSQKRLD